MHSRLAQIADDLKERAEAPTVTTREFLSWFGAKRRGFLVVAGIRDELREVGLRTEPDFQSSFIDAPLSFRAEDFDRTSEHGDVGDSEDSNAGAEVLSANSTPFDAPSYRVSRLEAANKSLVSVKPDATLREAMTQMMLNDFSQLPVMSNDRDVKGIVSWTSIGARLAVGPWREDSVELPVREFMETHHEIGLNSSLFSAIDVIVQHQYVLVRGSDQRITGIVTATDLSLQFRQLTEPFLLLGEVENHLRKLLVARFNKTELEAACLDKSRSVGGVADLTFGEYQRLLEAPENWKKLSIALDRVTFCQKLDKVREIRNDVMHFDPDGVAPEDLRELREFAQFMRLLDGVQGGAKAATP